MNQLYAPWRAAYVKEEKNNLQECPFCAAAQSDDDAAHMVLARNEHVLVLLNKYPYNTGHLLIIPLNHVAQLSDLSPEVRASIMEATAEWSQIVQRELNCQGFNIGLNIGKISGGSIPDHLHMHVLPRWQGDTNFLVTLAETKLISFSLSDLYHALMKQKNLSK